MHRPLARVSVCETYTLYNMTEISTPLVSEAATRASVAPAAARGPAWSCDSSISMTARSSAGEVGELIIRTDVPWALNSGYLP